MTSLLLTVPKTGEATGGVPLDPAPPQLEGWVETLRTGNFEDAAERVREVLQRYNHAELTPKVRFAALELLRPVVRELTASLEDRFLGGSFPLRDKPRARALLVAQMLDECAIGYKHIVNSSLGPVSPASCPADDVLHSMYCAVVFLSERLLHTYLIYVPEPDEIWGELHRLYRLAEERGVHGKHADRTVKNSDDMELHTINHAYKRIVMLYLANPYHLMGREAATVYQQLDRWTFNIRMVPFDRVPSIEGRFFVDMAGDEPPQFGRQDRKISSSVLLRVFDISRVLAGLSLQVKKFTEPNEEGKIPVMSFRERIYRDMLQRLERAWGGRRERKDERVAVSAHIAMAVGMSASHHFVSNEEPFMPERDEVRFYRPDGVKSALSLLPVDHEPWKSQEQLDKIDTGVTTVRTSQFEGAEDLWEKIYSTKARANVLQEELEPEFTAQLWAQINGSSGGLGVECDGRGKRVRVGDLVVMKHTNQFNADWRAGVVRWLRDLPDHRLDIGLKLLTGTVYAVAVRSIGGVGSGGEYFRSLLLRDGATKTLLLPCSIYDLGTQLVVNSRRMISFARLTQLLETTTSFAHFAYEQIEAPASEQKNIEALKTA